MSDTVRVDLGERSYDIRIGRDLPIGGALKGPGERRALVVSDTNVDPLYGAGCEAALRAVGLRVARAVVPAGEASKNTRMVSRLYEDAVTAGLDRSSVIVALGGGVIGDLAGFVAATFLRGVSLIQVPTTLLAMVDSSVGGKTGVNLPQGKNLVGAFYQPVEVVADLSTLRSLPEREYVSGLAEVVKYGVIWDAPLFARLEANADGLIRRDLDLLQEVVGRCCRIKAEIVAIDEREGGVRAILNFGHTLGHALEQVAGYGQWLHGEAIAIGMVYAAGLSTREKGLPQTDQDRLLGLLRRLGLPTSPEGSGAAARWPEVRAAMAADKKTLGDVPRFVLATRIGAVVFGAEVPADAMQSAFDSFAVTKP